jgi:TRAP transporter TAXI family solute receptor
MLRAVGGLFPEAVHVIVSADGPIRDVSQLKAQRVAVGLASSGSRFDAVAVLAAHDLQLRDLHEIADLPLDEALARLKGKRTDAVFVTAAVPIRALQQFAIDPGFRLLSLHADEVDHVAQLRRGLTRITLPPNTYPQQRDPVITVAALALLVTTTDAPAAEVQRVSELLSTRLVRPPTRGEVARASAAGGRDALSIPLHPGLAGRRP